jgi:hypothetical protein
VIAAISLAASCMSSSNYRDSGCIEKFAMLGRYFQKEWISDRINIDQIDLTSQQVLEPVQQTEISVGCALPTEALKLDEEVKIACGWVKMATGSRPEQFESPDTMLAAQRTDLLTMLFQERDHNE